MVSHVKHRYDSSHDQRHGAQQSHRQRQPHERTESGSSANGSSGKAIDHQAEKANKKPLTICSKGNLVTLFLPKWVYCYLPIIVSMISLAISLILVNYNRFLLESTLMGKADTLGWEIISLFSSFDKDGDNYLSIDEAVPLIAQFIQKSQGKDVILNADVWPEEDIVTIEARLLPLNLSTMTKDWEHDFNNNESFHGLFNWLTPHISSKDFGVSQFKDLLPEDIENIVEAGGVYSILDAPGSMFGPASLPSTRYYPPRAVGRSYTAFQLLSMLHPFVFLTMRFAPQGLYGCVRAVNARYVEVVFRMHVEFQLNEPPRFPFWFTPAQFTGSLLMLRDGSSVEHFHLFVPNDRRLNVDMEWLNEKDKPESMEVDIGYTPLMELVSRGPSRPQDTAADIDTSGFENPAQKLPVEIKWDSEMSHQEALDALERKLFPFKEIKYYNLSYAFALAEAENKLVHSILLWGALDDQSC